MPIKFLFIFLIFSNSLYSKSYDLDLDLAEKMALQKESSRSIYEKERQIISDKITEKTLSLFPSLTSCVSGKTNFKGPISPDFSVTLNQEIPNPFKWINEKKSLEYLNLAKQEKLEEKDLNVLEVLRKKIFKLKTLERKIENAKKNLTLVDGLVDETEKRYNSGIQASYDLKRLQIRQRQVTTSLQNLQKEIHTLEDELKLLLGLDESDVLRISREFSLDLSFLDETSFENKLSQSKLNGLSSLEFEYQSFEYSTKGKSYFYMPEINIQGTYSFNNSFLVSANLTWKIFSGGSTYYDFKESRLEKEKAYFVYLEKKDELTLKAHSLIHNLLNLKKDLVLEKKSLDDTLSILKASEKRYKLGTMSSQDLSADVSLYIKQEDDYLEMQNRALDLLIEYSTLISDKSFFLSFISWKT